MNEEGRWGGVVQEAEEGVARSPAPTRLRLTQKSYYLMVHMGYLSDKYFVLFKVGMSD